MPPAKKTACKAAKKTTRRAANKTARKAVKRSTKRPGQRTLSAAHKKALAEGRAMSATVDRYLAAVNTRKRRGRPISPAALIERLADAQVGVRTAAGVEKVLAAQEVRDLQAKLAQVNTASAVDVKSLETAFVKVAKRFGENRGIPL